MCVHNNLISKNPSHASRRMAVVQLKQIGYSFSQTVALFEQMSKTFKWVDRKNRDRRIYQIKFIYFHNPPYMHDSCKKIKNEHSICVGDICPYYFEVKLWKWKNKKHTAKKKRFRCLHHSAESVGIAKENWLILIDTTLQAVQHAIGLIVIEEIDKWHYL